MPRKRINVPENYNAPLPTRLRDLMSASGFTQADLAGHLGISRQSVSAYMDGSANPTPTTIVSIAEFLGVSTDYLLGVSHAKSRNPDLQSSCQYTGLSEGAIKQILDLQETETFLGNNCSVPMAQLTSMVLENPCFVPMMEDLQFCLDYIYRFEKKGRKVSDSDRQLINKAIADLREKTEADFVLLPDYRIPDYYRSQVEDFCAKLITSIIEDYKFSLDNTEGGVDGGELQEND